MNKSMVTCSSSVRRCALEKIFDKNDTRNESSTIKKINYVANLSSYQNFERSMSSLNKGTCAK